MRYPRTNPHTWQDIITDTARTEDKLFDDCAFTTRRAPRTTRREVGWRAAGGLRAQGAKPAKMCVASVQMRNRIWVNFADAYVRGRERSVSSLHWLQRSGGGVQARSCVRVVRAKGGGFWRSPAFSHLARWQRREAPKRCRGQHGRIRVAVRHGTRAVVACCG
jgi:hypothetical protein